MLFLTEEAQNSPYVMLELDQAFKQKKAIIPVLLDKIVQNPKTNFFLNAKQSVDATQNLTAAINGVISQIKSGEPTESNQTPYITCPRCGCSVLRFRNGKKHYLDTEKKLSNRFEDYLSIAVCIPFAFACYSIFYFSHLPGNTPIKPIVNYGISIFLLLLVLSLSWAFVCARRFSREWYSVRRSKLQVWKFVCLGCRRRFHYYAPLSDTPEDRVKELFYEVKPNKTRGPQ